MIATKKWKHFVNRYPKDNTSNPGQPLIDTRLGTGLSIVAEAVEQYYVPSGPSNDPVRAIVLKIVPYSAPHMSSLDPKLGIVANADKNQMKMLGLKCYVLGGDCDYINSDKIGTLDPAYIDLLPTFKATMLAGDTLPVVGDIVLVKYDNIFRRSKGEFVKVTGYDIYDILAKNANKKSLVNQFKAGSKKSPVSSWGDAGGE